MRKKWHQAGLVLAGLLVVVLFAGCVEVTVNDGSQESDNSNQTNQTNQTTQTTNQTVQNKNTSVEPVMTPTEVVQEYMNATLGTLPNAIVDYEYAKLYLTAELAAGLDDPSFIPTSYCIQNGPDDVSLGSEQTLSDGSVKIRAQGAWGSDYSDMWDFYLELEFDEWFITDIGCVQ